MILWFPSLQIQSPKFKIISNSPLAKGIHQVGKISRNIKFPLLQEWTKQGPLPS